MTFHVGQKVVCVDDGEGRFLYPGIIYNDGLSGLRRGEVYTVRDVIPNASVLHVWWVCGPAIRLVEIYRKPTLCERYEPLFAAARFRPVQEKGMSILRSIAANPKRELEGV